MFQVKSRYLEKPVIEDLEKKMVFLGGPRQVGKTTLALKLLGAKNDEHPAYLNWDNPLLRASLIKGEIPTSESLIVLDEIHKYKAWRNLVKGFFDVHRRSCRFLITGSARLDYYRRGGDSLQGRYHYYRFHPLSLYEINEKPTLTDFNHLLHYGGFPEPFFSSDDREYKRWQKERLSRVVYEDLAGLEKVREISSLEVLMSALPERVGSPLSIANLREDLSVAFETAEHWVQILERLYYCFRISPYGSTKIKGVKKEKKLYLWDWSQIPSPGARLENMVASNLLKYCHFHEDYNGEKMELKFLRDITKREIDFVVLKNNKPEFAVECKTGESAAAKNIAYFSERTNIPLFYQVHLGKKNVEVAKIRTRILPFTEFSKILKI